MSSPASREKREDDHAASMNFIASRPFTYLHVFSYSMRPGTRAANLPGQLPGATIKRRARELRALGEKKSAAFHRSQSGRTLSLLTLRHSDSTEFSDWTPALSSNFLKASPGWLLAAKSIRGRRMLLPRALGLRAQLVKTSGRASSRTSRTGRTGLRIFKPGREI